MAEFCLKCFNEMTGEHFTEKDVILEEDLCEGCAEVKPCVVAVKKWKRKGQIENIVRKVLPVVVVLSVIAGVILLIASVVTIVARK